jgi:hypothetical protein
MKQALRTTSINCIVAPAEAGAQSFVTQLRGGLDPSLRWDDGTSEHARLMLGVRA